MPLLEVTCEGMPCLEKTWRTNSLASIGEVMVLIVVKLVPTHLENHSTSPLNSFIGLSEPVHQEALDDFRSDDSMWEGYNPDHPQNISKWRLKRGIIEFPLCI